MCAYNVMCVTILYICRLLYNLALSCASILAADPSGEYFLRSANITPDDSSTSVFRDMTLYYDGVIGGWRQIADLNAAIE